MDWKDGLIAATIVGLGYLGFRSLRNDESWDGMTGSDFRKYNDTELDEQDRQDIVNYIEEDLNDPEHDDEWEENTGRPYTLQDAKVEVISQMNWFGIDRHYNEVALNRAKVERIIADNRKSRQKCSVCGDVAVHVLKKGDIVLCDKHYQQQFGKYSRKNAESFSADTISVKGEEFYPSNGLPFKGAGYTLYVLGECCVRAHQNSRNYYFCPTCGLSQQLARKMINEDIMFLNDKVMGYSAESFSADFSQKSESFSAEGIKGNWEGKLDDEPVYCPNCMWEGLESELADSFSWYIVICPQCNRTDWEYKWFDPYWKMQESSSADFPKSERKTCCLCGGIVHGYGHNPAPLDTLPNVCCDSCNYTRVIPARLRRAELGAESFSAGGGHTCVVCGDVATEQCDSCGQRVCEHDLNALIETGPDAGDYGCANCSGGWDAESSSAGLPKSDSSISDTIPKVDDEELDEYFDWIVTEMPESSEQTGKDYSRKVDYLAQRYSDYELKNAAVNAFMGGDMDAALLFKTALHRQGFIKVYQAQDIVGG